MQDSFIGGCSTWHKFISLSMLAWEASKELGDLDQSRVRVEIGRLQAISMIPVT